MPKPEVAELAAQPAFFKSLETDEGYGDPKKQVKAQLEHYNAQLSELLEPRHQLQFVPSAPFDVIARMEADGVTSSDDSWNLVASYFLSWAPHGVKTMPVVLRESHKRGARLSAATLQMYESRLDARHAKFSFRRKISGRTRKQALAPEQYFSSQREQGSSTRPKYARVDALGIPTHDAKHKLLDADVRKALEIEFDQAVARYASSGASTAGAASASLSAKFNKADLAASGLRLVAAEKRYLECYKEGKLDEYKGMLDEDAEQAPEIQAAPAVVRKVAA